MLVPGAFSPPGRRFSFPFSFLGFSSLSSSASSSPVLGPSAPGDSLNSSYQDCPDLSACFPSSLGGGLAFHSWLKFLRPANPRSSRRTRNSNEIPLIQEGGEDFPALSRPSLINLPSDLLEDYLPAFLDAASLVKFSCATSCLRSIADEGPLWRHLCERKFPFEWQQKLKARDVEQQTEANWRDCYQLLSHVHWEFFNSPQLFNEARGQDVRIKLCVFGSGCARLLRKFGRLDGRPGLGMEFCDRRVYLKKKIVALRLLTAEKENNTVEILHVRSLLLRACDGLILSFNTADRASFNAVTKLRTDLQVVRPFPILLVGEDEKQAARVVSSEEIDLFCLQTQLLYMEIDPNDGCAVEDCLFQATALCLASILPEIPVATPLFEAFAASRGSLGMAASTRQEEEERGPSPRCLIQ